MVELKNKRACVVGSRKLTNQDKTRISVIGNLLRALDVSGASGNAEGSDIEWDNYLFVQHFLPWNGHQSTPDHPKKFNGDNGCQYLSLEYCPEELHQRARLIAEQHHPNWNYLKRGGRAMHTRNVFQALGVELIPETYADLTIYTADETPARKVKGGTSTAVEISRSHNIPTFNLRFDSDYYELKGVLEGMLNG